mmetsp:Transcript_31797/g.83299  ORF Transcript_31797/g.83299 Transcript_31797/m.83299 type:complete len:253 (-) Transcript_31797:424-1182(-)
MVESNDTFPSEEWKNSHTSFAVHPLNFASTRVRSMTSLPGPGISVRVTVMSAVLCTGCHDIAPVLSIRSSASVTFRSTNALYLKRSASDADIPDLSVDILLACRTSMSFCSSCSFSIWSNPVSTASKNSSSSNSHSGPSRTSLPARELTLFVRSREPVPAISTAAAAAAPFAAVLSRAITRASASAARSFAAFNANISSCNRHDCSASTAAAPSTRSLKASVAPAMVDLKSKASFRTAVQTTGSFPVSITVQ